MNLVLVEEVYKFNFSNIISYMQLENNFIDYFSYFWHIYENIHFQRFNYEPPEIHKM